MHFQPLMRLLPALLLGLATPVSAQDSTDEPAATPEIAIRDATDVDLDSFLWTNRVLAVFADTPADPRFIKQLELLEARPTDLSDRDVVIVTDSDPDASSELRASLRPRGFALVLVDKDGIVKLRKPSPWSSREIARSIDKTPLRRQEIRDQLNPGG